ncbi:zinc finger protein 436 isoform X1 [Neocloeon triangulifer]|uniref:zinc finger protein 436 isoform X1 n=1 Tax=Neocloeon triangulifer TaxID=2078957 RepID=UPI00286F15A3|nr:zinc finger protein 436 isoform X1 [Neocloeon triangulifer]
MADTAVAPRQTRRSTRNKEELTNGVAGSPEAPAAKKGKKNAAKKETKAAKQPKSPVKVDKTKQNLMWKYLSPTNSQKKKGKEVNNENASEKTGGQNKSPKTPGLSTFGKKLKELMDNEPQPGSSTEQNHSPVDVYEFNQLPGEEPPSKKTKKKINQRARNNFVELEDGEITLSEQMKGVMLAKVNNLIDETAAPAALGKCHCCFEDLETAHSGGDYECVDCQKKFKLKSSLERHRRVIHFEGETYSCPECDARCPDKGTLARHMYTHTGLKPYTCNRCDKMFSRKYHLERHVIQTGCDGKPKPSHPCQVCGRMFSRKDNLREHLRAHAGQVKRKKKYNCEFCNKEFHGTSLLQIHTRIHTGERPYPCDFCEKTFPSSGAMKKHRRMHTGERPYECKECFAKFAAKETLNRHVKTHTGVKPHTCGYCGKSFIQASQLRSHIFHHTGEYGFTCDICNKSFNRRVRLSMHIKYVHEGAKPYECDQCTKTFVRKEDLARHTILHSGVKSHKCPICEKQFAMKSSLKIHLLTHTKEPPRSCDECGRAFIRQDCLLRHMRSKHRDMLEEILAEAEKKKLQQQLLATQAAQAAASTGLSMGAALATTTQLAGLMGAPQSGGSMSEKALSDSIRELLSLLVDEATLAAFGWPDETVDKLLEAVIRRCGHAPALAEDYSPIDRLRENAKLLFTVVIDDSAVKTLLNNQTVDEVILHVLRLAKG